MKLKPLFNLRNLLLLPVVPVRLVLFLLLVICQKISDVADALLDILPGLEFTLPSSQREETEAERKVRLVNSMPFRPGPTNLD